MVPVMCIVQEGQISHEAETGLKAEIEAFALRSFCEPATIDWIVVPRGNGYTAGKLSSSVIASLHADRALHQSERISLLKELGAICAKQTGLSAGEIVTAIRNPAA